MAGAFRGASFQWFWRMSNGKVVELCLNLRDARQLHL
jgi:hypothetical protein